MNKRITITKHDYELIEWLVENYKNNYNIGFPSIQNVNELVEKFKVES